MKKFRFKYQTVIKTKEIFLEKKMKEIALVEREIENINGMILEHRKERKNAAKEKLGSPINNSTDMKFVNNFQRYIDSKIDSCKKQLVEKEKVRGLLVSELMTIYKELKIHENLKEKHHENYMIEFKREEQKEIDEIASNRSR
ncbi:MAG: flagellar export protein FliJ [Melioribacteraceae bacterium]|nr:flagellar export protein FliJ [Melioribacteraceae bacterium]MCF8353731.1 flagellar export protein FliJ [Melioribacteraceae bacterium]MCF8392460.1 flagellar export protein FliJ [Melioribacteraceae bacterium]MCF8418371.1 flagellar export protein FliJ [Melioribacteraceae bacterium]